MAGGTGVLVAGDEPVAEEQPVLEFLNGDWVLPWTEAVLGLQSNSLANDLGWGRRTQGAQASTTSQFRASNVSSGSIASVLPSTRYGGFASR
jgi:hypothetical protein